MKILVIDDSSDVRGLLDEVLTAEGYEVIPSMDGRDGLEKARTVGPSLILLDQRLPRMDGWEVCRVLKQDPETRRIPVIFISGLPDKNNIVIGLELGADDYVTKPFDSREIVARVRTALRRLLFPSSTNEQEALRVGVLQMDRERFTASIDEGPLPLSVLEFKILWALAESPGIVLSRERILDKVTGGEVVVTDRTVDVHITAIRKKLGARADLVQTIRGVGYRICEA